MYLFCFKCFITHVLSKSPLRGKCRNIIDLFFNSMYIKDQWLHKICNFAIFVTFDENHFHTFSQTFTMCSFILVGAMITSLLTDFYFNSLHSDIDIHILFTALSTFPWVLTKRITFTIRSFSNWLSFPNYSCDHYMHIWIKGDIVWRS